MTEKDLNNVSKKSIIFENFKKGFGSILGCSGALLLIFIFIVILGGVISVSENGKTANINETKVKSGSLDKIAIIHVNGEITGTSSSIGGQTVANVSQIENQIQKAKDDKSVKAVILAVDSPGGETTASFDLYNAVRELNTKKKVVVQMGSVAASGGYLISLGGEKILAKPDTITGSIGVIMTAPNLKGLYDKIGYSENVIKSGELKDIGSASRTMTDAERGILQTIVNEAFDRFVGTVAERRNITAEKARLASNGGVIYTSTQAKNAGLIDQVVTGVGFASAIAEAENAVGSHGLEVVEYSVNQSFIASLLSSASAKWNLFSNANISASPKIKYLWTIN